MSVELPKDADGREIPLDTTVLYNEEGNPQDVARFTYSLRNMPLNRRWAVVFINASCKYASDMFLNPPEPPDSWENLLDDLSEAGDARYCEACTYFHRDKDEDGCISCPGGEDGCVRIAMRDIADRIRKLRGEC